MVNRVLLLMIVMSLELLADYHSLHISLKLCVL